MKSIIAMIIVLAPFMSHAYSETDRVTLTQKASALAQLAEGNSEYFQLSPTTKRLLTALVSGQKEILRNGVRVTVLKTECNSGTGESSCTVEIGVQKNSGESVVIGIEYSIDRNGVVGGASETVIAG